MITAIQWIRLENFGLAEEKIKEVLRPETQGWPSVWTCRGSGWLSARWDWSVGEQWPRREGEPRPVWAEREGQPQYLWRGGCHRWGTSSVSEHFLVRSEIKKEVSLMSHLSLRFRSLPGAQDCWPDTSPGKPWVTCHTWWWWRGAVGWCPWCGEAAAWSPGDTSEEAEQ